MNWKKDQEEKLNSALKIKMIAGLFFLIFVSSLFAADTITIINKTPINLHGAFYYKNEAIERIDESFQLINNQSVKVERPSRKFKYDRQLYFSVFDETLEPKLTRGQSNFMPHFNVGTLKGTTFYIVFDGEKFLGLNEIEYGLLPVKQFFEKTGTALTSSMFKALRSNYGNYPHKTETATVRTDDEIAAPEKAFLAARAPRIKQSLEELLQEKIADHEMPRIAFCASGGGYRAMLSFLGYYKAAQDTKLLNTVSYMAGLSGGAWGVTMATMMENPLEQVIERIDNKKISDDINMSQFMDVLWEKFIFNQPISLIDIYGLMLGNRLLGGISKNPYDLTLSMQQNRLRASLRPYPIYSAIMTHEPYEWVDFTPHEVGSTYLHGFIPSWSFNSLFKNKKSVFIAPEEALGFLMGIWGSAISANIKEIYQEFRSNIDSPVILSALDLGTSEQLLGSQRILPAKVANFTFGMHESPRWQQKELTLIDAGISFNIPLPPLLHRDVDIILVFDNTAYSKGAKPALALACAEEYAKKKNLSCPVINYEKISEQLMSVFWDKHNKDAPIIIYFPLIKNDEFSASFDPADCIKHSYCSTTNFLYSKEQAEELSGLTRFTLKNATPQIIEIIREFIHRRRTNRPQASA